MVTTYGLVEKLRVTGTLERKTFRDWSNRIASKELALHMVDLSSILAPYLVF